MAYPTTIDTFEPRTDNVDDVMATDINSVYTVVELIETALGTAPQGTAADVKTRLAHSISDGGYLSFDDTTALTIASGAITVTQNFHRIDGEGSASDNLDTINGGEAGWLLVLRSVNDARDITIRHGVDNIYCAGGVNFTLDQTNEMAILIYDGNQSKWLAGKSQSGASLTGEGTANYIPFYSATNTLTNSADFTFTTAAGLVGNESGGTAVDFRWETDSNTHAFFVDASGDAVYFGGTGAGDWMSVKETTGVVINETGGTAIDFRAESDTNEYMLFLDASANTFQVGDDTGGNYTVFAGNGAMTLTGTATIRTATAVRRRYYHLSLASANPGASGATWTAPSANTLGGWQVDAAGEVLYLQTDVHADWDAASDLTVEIKFEVNVNNTGGGAGDTVDLKLVCYYKGDAETACKTQTQEVATVVGQSAQYKRFTCTFTINFDEVSNVVEAGDVIRMILNLETDTSEVDNIIINSCEYWYNTTHIGIESGDV